LTFYEKSCELLIIMRPSILCLVALFGALFFTQVAHAAQSLQDQYLQIYLLIQEADKMEADGQKPAAYRRYETALNRLQALPKEWEPGIVGYRIKFCKEKLAALQDSADQNSTAPPATTSAATPPITTAPPQQDTTAIRQNISQIEVELARTKKDLASALQESKQLRSKLDETEKQLSDARSNNLGDKMTELTAQNKTLRDQLAQAQDEKARLLEDARSKSSDQKVAELLQQNNGLKADLARAEEIIKTLQSGTGETSVAALQVQLKKVQEQLAQQQQANTAFEQSTADLKKQLDEARANLAQARQQLASAPGAESSQRENEVLRSIINRQMQEQARRDAAKKLAQEELDSLKTKSDVLRQQIDILGSPIVVLSEEERALLRTPTAQIVSANNVLKAPLTQATPDNASTTTTTATTATPPASAPENPPVDYRTKPRIPDDMRQVAQQASDLFAQKKYDDACAAYQKIVDKYPESLYAWSNMGVVRFQQQNYAEAQRALLQAVKLSPSDGFSYSILGIVYYQLGKYDEAVNALTKAAALDPNDAKTLNYLGIACSQKGLQEAAEQQLRKAIELDPNYGDAHFNLAVIYATQKPPAKELAKRHYKQALDLGIPKDPQLDKMLLN